jgi:hypothetical protein
MICYVPACAIVGLGSHIKCFVLRVEIMMFP